MATPPLSDELCRNAWEMAKEVGSVNAASTKYGIARATLQHRIQQAMARFGLPNPTTPMAGFPPRFEAQKIPSKARPIEEIISHRLAESERARIYEDATNMIRVDLKMDGPIGLFIQGDPHIDNPGCDFKLLKEHLEICAARPAIFAGCIGDVQDNWIGRLGRLYEETTVNNKEIWALVEWMFKGAGVHWAWLVRGNHDAWLGRGDPLDWISREADIGVDRPSGVRMAFRHPNGVETRMHARHDFNGHSIYNPLHALKREVLHGPRDHIMVAGHRHIGADARDVNGNGFPFVMVRVSGYKISDSYRHTLGLHAKPLHPSALVIVDPDEPEHSCDRVWTAPSVEAGADFLDFKRERWNARARVSPKPKPRSR